MSVTTRNSTNPEGTRVKNDHSLPLGKVAGCLESGPGGLLSYSFRNSEGKVRQPAIDSSGSFFSQGGTPVVEAA